MSIINTVGNHAPPTSLTQHGTRLSCRLDSPASLSGPPVTILHLAGELDLSTQSLAGTALSAGLYAVTARAAADNVAVDDLAVDDLAAGSLAAGGPGAGPDAAPGVLVIDVAGLGFCGACGLELLAETADEAAEAGAGYALAGPSPHLQRVTALLPAPEQIPTHPSVRDAVRALLQDRASARPV